MFYFAIKDIFLIIYGSPPEVVNLDYSFAVIPLLTWFWLLSVGGSISFVLKKKPVWSNRMNKTLGSYIPIALACLAFLLGGFGKPYLAKSLLQDGYKLERTLEASAPWRFDTDVYIKVQK